MSYSMFYKLIKMKPVNAAKAIYASTQEAAYEMRRLSTKSPLRLAALRDALNFAHPNNLGNS